WPFIPNASGIADYKAKSYIHRLRNNTSPPIQDVNTLADYLALSTWSHAFDGWRYLSKSALSLLRGARSVALHMAYYAELRAALSILAGAGIGIVDYNHFGLTSAGSTN